MRQKRADSAFGFWIVKAVLAIAAIGTAACNNSLQGFGGFVGNTPNNPPVSAFKVLGTPGMQFTATVSNADSSWDVAGVVPLNIIITNNQIPVEMIATKLTNDFNLMSIELVNGFKVSAVASTSMPYGVVSLSSGTLPKLSPPANPDLRIAVLGPAAERYQAFIEDSQIGYVATTQAPTIFLIDNPNGKVDGQFTQVQNFGPFQINMTLNGGVVATASGGPFVIIRQP